MELPSLPNSKTLPYYAIAVLIAFCGALLAHIVQQNAECKQERKDQAVEHVKEINACRAETTLAVERLTEYLKEQAAINKGLADEIRRLKQQQ